MRRSFLFGWRSAEHGAEPEDGQVHGHAESDSIECARQRADSPRCAGGGPAVSPSPAPGSGGVAVEPVEARLVSRYGWVIGIVVRQASPHAVAWRWWSGTASGTALSESDAVARVAAKSE
jgi:hypothetical protein